MKWHEKYIHPITTYQEFDHMEDNKVTNQSVWMNMMTGSIGT
jgi:hypothetical protein